MSEVWVVSDTHFGHKNIIAYCGRPFKSVEEMDEDMVKKWNERVTPQDKIYHLGDVYFADGWKHLDRLNGKKRLILGNHDDDIPQLQKYFQKISLWRDWAEYNILMSHIPIHPDHIVWNKLWQVPRRNIHGHIHQKQVLLPSGVPDKRYGCVCVEHTDYYPVHIETLSAVTSKI